MQRTKIALSILLSIVMILSLFTIIPTSAGAAIVDPAATGDGDTITIYVVNDAGWSNVKVYYWGGSQGSNWPGVDMTSLAGTRVFTYTIPSDTTSLLFNNSAANTYDNPYNQTLDISSGIADGTVWNIKSSTSYDSYNNKHKNEWEVRPSYYLVGDMNNWTQIADYAFLPSQNNDGVLEYKLSGVQLSASDLNDSNSGVKVSSSNNLWYPNIKEEYINAPNYKITADGTYDVYFRPEFNGDADPASGWYYRCFYFANVTPYTIKWMNGNDVLKEDTVTYGNTPSYDGATPTRNVSSDKMDVFTGWDKDITPATEDITYNAQFEEKDRFDGHSISLNGDIAINYYIHLTDEELAEEKIVTFEWTVNGRQNHIEHTIVATDRQADGRYKVSCPVAVAEMNYTVTASIDLCGETVTDTYSVKQYAGIILSPEYEASYVAPSENKTYAKLKALVTAMLDYGAMAQLKFNRTDVDLANGQNEEYSPAEIPASQVPDPEVSFLSQYGLTYTGSTVVFLSQTSLRHYFTCDNVAVLDNLSISFGENTNVEYKTKGDEIYFELSDIPAAKLSTRFSLEFGGNQKYDYSVIDYARACVNSETMSDSMKKLAKATYWYSDAADAYFA